MPWPSSQLSDGNEYEVRHTIDSGFKARRLGTSLSADGSDTVVDALREAFEGTPDDQAEQEIEYAAARIMEQGFTNIPQQHRGQ